MEEFKATQITEEESEKLSRKDRKKLEKAEDSGHGFKFGTFLKSLLPMLLLVIVQLVAFMPPIMSAAFRVLARPDAEEITSDMTSYISAVMDEAGDAVQYGYLAYAIVGILIFGWWYYKSFASKTEKRPVKKAFTKKGFPFVLLMIFGAWGLTEGLMAAMGVLFPDLIEEYAELIESTGLSGGSWAIMLVVWLLGPVVEELCFRGLSYNYLLKSGLPVAAAVALQGIFFGVFHMNLVQGIYASILGIIIGFCYARYKSIFVSISCHVFFNLLGTICSGVLEMIAPPVPVYIVLGLAGVALVVMSVVKVCKDAEAPSGVIPAASDV